MSPAALALKLHDSRLGKPAKVLPATFKKRDLLRLMTCGSVDDGKSTLLGRLMFDAGALPDDRREALESAAPEGGMPDFASLLDGLEAEREQGITIDVAWRTFSTAGRSLVVADVPGHEQYTRNAANAASLSDAALLVVDATRGVSPQTRRHLAVCGLFGIAHAVVAVTKMDEAGFVRDAFEAVVEALAPAARRALGSDAVFVPVSGRAGDNVVARSERMPWYDGPTLLQWIETVEPARTPTEAVFRFPVQLVLRLDGGERRLAGTVASGRIAVGDVVSVAGSGASARIAGIDTPAGPRKQAVAGQAVSLSLDRQIDVSRGDVLALRDEAPVVSDHVEADILWLGREPLTPGRSYEMRAGARFVQASVLRIHHRLDVDHDSLGTASQLTLNDIARCDLKIALPLPFDRYVENRTTGAFVLIDRATAQTVAAGMVRDPMPPSAQVVRQGYAVDRAARARAKGQMPSVLWFTGLPSAGKSTLADAVERRLFARGLHTTVLDGDNLRLGLNSDLGFGEADRVENIRRAGEVARLMSDAGLIVLCAFVSPFAAERAAVRAKFAAGEFVEVFVDTPAEECMRRDPKGLYARAKAGKVCSVTGYDAPYEAPDAPEIRLASACASADELAEQVVAWLVAQGRIA